MLLTYAILQASYALLALVVLHALEKSRNKYKQPISLKYLFTLPGKLTSPTNLGRLAVYVWVHAGWGV